MNYFVMLDYPSGEITPLVDEDMSVMLFDSIPDACRAAVDNPLGKNVGYEVFERGDGVA